MARTTLILRDDVLAQLRALAAREQRTLTEQIDIILRRGLGRSEVSEPRRTYGVKPSTFKSGPRTGVDLEDKDLLRDLMDDRS